MPVWQPPAPASDTMVVSGNQVPGHGAGALAELKIVAGPDAGHTFRVGAQPVRVGRASDNELILRDPATSGHHARLELRTTQFFIVDLGSTNGTLVNGEPIQERELRGGDRITIGQNSVTFSTL